MAYNTFTPIVTDGLILCLDAGNTKSYPGSGTLWTDLTKNKLNGTLTNGPTFNSSNIGSIVFDGTNDYVTLGDNNLFSFTSGGGVDIPFSISGWFKLNAYGTGIFTYSMLVCKSQYINTWTNNREWQFSHSNTLGFALVLLDADGASYIGKVLNSPLALNTWYHLAATYSGSKNSSGIRLYLNGISVTGADLNSGSYNGMINTSVTLEFGRQNQTPISGSSDLGYLNGNISMVQIYRNKVLTASEVLQNYNATKFRFQ